MIFYINAIEGHVNASMLNYYVNQSSDIYLQQCDSCTNDQIVDHFHQFIKKIKTEIISHQTYLSTYFIFP